MGKMYLTPSGEKMYWDAWEPVARRRYAEAVKALGYDDFSIVDLLADNFTWSLGTCVEMARRIKPEKYLRPDGR